MAFACLVCGEAIHDMWNLVGEVDLRRMHRACMDFIFQEARNNLELDIDEETLERDLANRDIRMLSTTEPPAPIPEPAEEDLFGLALAVYSVARQDQAS